MWPAAAVATTVTLGEWVHLLCYTLKGYVLHFAQCSNLELKASSFFFFYLFALASALASARISFYDFCLSFSVSRLPFAVHSALFKVPTLSEIENFCRLFSLSLVSISIWHVQFLIALNAGTAAASSAHLVVYLSPCLSCCLSVPQLACHLAYLYGAVV